MKKTNVLFLFADDQRFNTIGTVNNPQIITPNIDALSMSGTGCSNAYIMGGSCAAVCMPSRAMLHTGKNLFQFENSGENIPDDFTLMGEHFRRNGYQTFGTGKWHNGTSSFTRSFSSGGKIFFGGMDDHWNVPYCDYRSNGDYPNPIMHDFDYDKETKESKILKVFDRVEKGRHSTDLFTEEAIDFLSIRSDQDPFFMYVSFMAPHDPRVMPKKYLDMYDPDSITLPENFLPQHPFDNGELQVRDELLATFPRSSEDVRRQLMEYYAMITHLDDGIGKIISKLKEIGEYENTIIVFSADNGLALGSHGLMGKQNMYDHSLHVPLIISGPGIPENKQIDAFCYLFDLFPTLCDFTDIPVPENIDGQSFFPVISIKNQEKTIRPSLFFAYKNIQRAYMDEQYKLIEYVVDSKKSIQLFNVKNDPLEMHNIADTSSGREVVAELHQLLINSMRYYGDQATRKFEELNPWNQ